MNGTQRLDAFFKDIGGRTMARGTVALGATWSTFETDTADLAGAVGKFVPATINQVFDQIPMMLVQAQSNGATISYRCMAAAGPFD